MTKTSTFFLFETAEETTESFAWDAKNLEVSGPVSRSSPNLLDEYPS